MIEAPSNTRFSFPLVLSTMAGIRPLACSESAQCIFNTGSNAHTIDPEVFRLFLLCLRDVDMIDFVVDA